MNHINHRQCTVHYINTINIIFVYASRQHTCTHNSHIWILHRIPSHRATNCSMESPFRKCPLFFIFSVYFCCCIFIYLVLIGDAVIQTTIQTGCRCIIIAYVHVISKLSNIIRCWFLMFHVFQKAIQNCCCSNYFAAVRMKMNFLEFCNCRNVSRIFRMEIFNQTGST